LTAGGLPRTVPRVHVQLFMVIEPFPIMICKAYLDVTKLSLKYSILKGGHFFLFSWFNMFIKHYTSSVTVASSTAHPIR